VFLSNNNFEFDKPFIIIIQPLYPELWLNISNGDILYAMEGNKKLPKQR